VKKIYFLGGKLHIGFYTNAYNPTISGVVRSVGSFRKALSELGHNVFVFSPQTEDYEDTEPFIFRYPSLDIPQFPDLPFVIPISSSIDHILPSLKMDVIHSHHPVLLGQTAAHNSAKYNLPLVFTFHSRYWEYSRYAGSFGQDFIKEQIDNVLCEYLQKCHHIITPSDSLREVLMEEYGFSEQITTIPTGIDMTLFENLNRSSERQKHKWDEEDIILISAGRLAIEKNWDTLMEAAALVMLKDPRVRLVLLGEGSERKKLLKKAKTLGISGRVEMPGGIDLDEVGNYLVAADIFCFASVAEAQGLVTLEAMGAGLPVAAVDGSGTRDVLEDGIQGFMTANDAEALAQGIEKIAFDADLRLKMGQAARIRAHEFNIINQAHKLLDVYDLARESARKGNLVRCNR
jgi:glycosyltransferase involved in cell wall biosynthesis